MGKQDRIANRQQRQGAGFFAVVAELRIRTHIGSFLGYLISFARHYDSLSHLHSRFDERTIIKDAAPDSSVTGLSSGSPHMAGQMSLGPCRLATDHHRRIPE